ncbi:MAG: hypothetical protein K2N34_14835 [Lachnospiraceae bacterium]|nr:hypothetical protein [Lachnospiraceae bacterium]
MKKDRGEKSSKVRKERKQMSSTNKTMLVFLVTLIIYMAIILPIRLCVAVFSWHWFVFGLIAVIIPFAFIYFQLWPQKKFTLTDVRKKDASVITVRYILYFWLLDCLYMTIFNQWKILVYILGLIILIKIFYSLSVTFLGKKQKNTILDISIVLDFLLGLGLTVYLIYLIPDRLSNLQTIITAIVAAVYGGLLTLVGVAWTIKYSEKQKHEDELAKARPLFTFNMISNEKLNDINNQKVCLASSNKGVQSFTELENSANSSFTITRFFYDNKWHGTVVNNTMLPNNKLLVQLYRKNIIEHPIMEVKDIYGRKFYYDLMFLCMPSLLDIQFCTLGELKEITQQELQARNIPIE